MPRFSALRFLGFTWDVVDGTEEFKNTNAWGMANIETQTIKLSPILEGDNELNILLHESIHVINRAVILRLNEDTIDRLTTVLFAFIRDNPLFIEAILRG